MKDKFWLALCFVSFFSQAELTPKSHTGWLGIDYQANVGIDTGYNDNVTFQPDPLYASESFFYRINPEIRMIGQRYTDTYVLSYSGDYLKYEDASSDDANKHDLSFYGEWWLGFKHSVKLNLDNTINREQRGRELTEGLLPSQLALYGIDEGLKTNFFNGEVRYNYGAPEGRGSLQFALQQKRLDYTDLSSVEQASSDFYQYVLAQEWVESSAIVELFDKYSKVSRFRYSFITNHRDYENQIKNSNEYFLVVGVQTELTGKSYIDFNLAWLYKNFLNNSDSDDFNGLNWNFKYRWQPVNYSTLELQTSRTVKDPNESGGYIKDNKYGISWKHYWWVDRLYTRFEFLYNDLDYVNMNTRRNDKQYTSTVAIGYDYRQSVYMELSYQDLRVGSNLVTDTFYIGENGTVPVNRTLGLDKSLIMLTFKVNI
ncbi:hypothetical protein [Vibrio litoralis]|uniref:hypothetical protein n=1 Tax=Vibrio litoralis TaxID=335972 RepID=UPI00047F0A61|nr:hypothetical protein [Vibrio litoralis]